MSNKQVKPRESLGRASSDSHQVASANTNEKFFVETPSISLPRGGGAIKGIDEKFRVNASNGTASVNIALPFSNARGYSPSLSINYDSGSGNGIFGLGWQLSIPSIRRKTGQALPKYVDDDDSDVYLLSGAEDLVPEYKKDSAGNFIVNPDGKYAINEFSSTDNNFLIRRYRPRIEGLFARIERWLEKSTGFIHWRIVTKENVTTIYGRSLQSRISNPLNELQIYEWFIEFTYDDKGNCTLYEYKQEDLVGIPAAKIHNRNRVNGNSPFTNAYLKRIRYGNVSMYKMHGDPIPTEFMFETVFDYGEHGDAVPFNAAGNWNFRADAFSDYRSGFEIRTCRLCKRVLQYHHFAELPGGSALVKGVHFSYDNNDADGFTFLAAVTHIGYTKHDDATYTEKSIPPLTFEYTKHKWNEDVKTVGPEKLENAPVGISEPLFQFTDLYSEGLSGILSEQTDGWFYKSNLGNGEFAPAKLITSKPSYNGLGTGSLQLADLESNGLKQLVNWNPPAPGFFEIDSEGDWQPYQPFKDVPNINFKDSNTKLIDLTGDGQSEVLITEENVFTWYTSEGKKGYGLPQRVHKPYDEEKGPSIVFSDPTQTIFLSNMSGGGLSDIVRIRNGEVCYWPNLGYGKFGAKVSMDNAPTFDHPDRFDPALIKLADIDGSGTTDIIYLGRNTISIWFNQQGNSFSSSPRVIKAFPEINTQTKVSIIDLLGTGVSCIVWSSPLPLHGGSALRYIDLMNSEKPHIMNRYFNNLGKETEIHYKPSTHYYIQDKLAGTPWVTKLHFPVQCVAKVVTYDRIIKTRFATEYSYHHGYYDHYEKEFRGFGRVDQKDAEDIAHFIKQSGSSRNNIVDASLHQDPVLIKTWFHTGAFLDRKKILDQFAHEYFQNGAVAEKNLPQPELPDSLTTDEWRQSLRACKTTMLRKEIYALDNSSSQDLPYSVEQHNCLVKQLQPKGQNKYAVFLSHESESITYHYERNPSDPRVAQNFILEIDAYANVLRSASVAYKRNPPTAPAPPHELEQALVHITTNENTYTNGVSQILDYRTPVLSSAKSYELDGYPAFSGYLSIETVRGLCVSATPIDYEVSFNGSLQKRLLEYTRQQYRADDGFTILPFGTIESKGLKHESFKAAFNRNMLDASFNTKISLPALDSILVNTNKGGFLFVDNYYWVSSGTVQYDIDHFFLVINSTDPFGNTNSIEYDSNYFLFVKTSRDALNNILRVKEISPGDFAFNYRTLSPYIIMDANNNEMAIRYDEIGMAVKTFMIGKPGIDHGDEIDESKKELKNAIDHPTTEIDYHILEWFNQVSAIGFDITNYKPRPTYTKVRVRETHYHAHPTHQTRWNEVYSYSDGAGHEILKKVQAEPGEALEVQPDGTVAEVNTKLLSPLKLRWIGNGRVVFNNKGNVVKSYEPYFTTSPDYDDERQMVSLGVTTIMEYDPLDRVVKITNPDRTFTKVEFTAWHEVEFDANDTVIDSPWFVDRGSPNPSGSEPTAALPRSAWLSSQHYNTPTRKYYDSLGRVFLTIADNKTETLSNKIKFDIEGKELEIRDALGRVVMVYTYDMLGNKLSQSSLDAGTRWNVTDIRKNPLLSWDDLGRQLSFDYDLLRRPTRTSIKIGLASPFVVSKSEYGEGAPADQSNNLRGTLYRQYDQSGISTNVSYDFKGKPLTISKQFVANYKDEIDWTTPGSVALESEVYSGSTIYDAISRPVEMVTPHSATMQPSLIRMAYDVGSHLAKVDVKVRNAGSFMNFVSGIEYDAKGQRREIFYGNNTATKYTYERETFHLLRVVTTRNAGTDILQDLNYTYDACGNIVQINDDAQNDIFFDSEHVKALNQFEYDAIYQLIKATGRKHAGQTDIRRKSQLRNGDLFDFYFFKNSTTHNPNDANAFRNYTERYIYDKSGNMKRQQHTARNSNWTRNFEYDYNNDQNNHLTNTSIGGDSYDYAYDSHGNMLGLETVIGEVWDFLDQFREVDLGGGGIAYYVYDASGQRRRKIIERLDGSKKERLYLGGLEIYKEINSVGSVTLQRETLHVMDDQKRIAIVESPVTIPAGSPELQLIRFNYDNHIGSASYELDHLGQIISYEEYFPFGTTSYYTVDATREVPVKRYRFTAKERDEETGLSYHGARHYAPWLCRWNKADPAGIGDGLNMFVYAGNRPIGSSDPTGLWEWPSARTVAIVAAVVVVAVVVTVATAGAGTMLVGAAVGAAGLTGGAATAATAVGAVAVAAGSGALGSMAATTTSVGLNEGRLPTRAEVGEAAASGAVAGVVTLGLGTAVSAGARGAVSAARSAATATAVTRAVTTTARVASSTGRAGTATRAALRAGRGAVSGGAGGASYEATRQVVSGERAARGGFDGGRIVESALVAGAFGATADAVAGPAMQALGNRAFSSGRSFGGRIRTALAPRRGITTMPSDPEGTLGISSDRPQQIAEAFKNRFGQYPRRMSIGGSRSEAFTEGAWTDDPYSGPTKSDVDLIIETEIPGLDKSRGAGFDFFRDVNPGKVPEGVTGLGTGPTEAMISNTPGSIPKAGTIDPFFRAPGDVHPPAVEIWRLGN